MIQGPPMDPREPPKWVDEVLNVPAATSLPLRSALLLSSSVIVMLRYFRQVREERELAAASHVIRLGRDAGSSLRASPATCCAPLLSLS